MKQFLIVSLFVSFASQAFASDIVCRIGKSVLNNGEIEFKLLKEKTMKSKGIDSLVTEDETQEKSDVNPGIYNLKNEVQLWINVKDSKQPSALVRSSINSVVVELKNATYVEAKYEHKGDTYRSRLRGFHSGTPAGEQISVPEYLFQCDFNVLPQ